MISLLSEDHPLKKKQNNNNTNPTLLFSPKTTPPDPIWIITRDLHFQSFQQNAELKRKKKKN